MENSFDMIPWIINTLLIILITIAGFSIKSFVAEVKEMKNTKVNKEPCELKHERIDEIHEEIKEKANERHIEVKDSLSDIKSEISNQNNFAQIFAEVGQEIVKAINKGNE
jgi:hypothetical protein